MTLFISYLFLFFIITNCCFSSINYASSVVYTSVNFDSNDNCMNWNAHLDIASDSDKGSVQIGFTVIKEFEKCFSSYEVYLYKLYFGQTQSCETKEKTRIREENTQINSAEFENLQKGHYCVLVIPCKVSWSINILANFSSKMKVKTKKKCFGEWALHSDVVSITEKRKSLKKLHEITHPPFSVSEIISATFILVLIFVCGMWLCWKFIPRTNMKNPAYHIMTDITVIPSISYQDDIVVSILHDTGTKRIVSLLKNFLIPDTASSVKTMEDEIEEILVDPPTWLNKTLRYECSKINGQCDSNKRFIIVLSEYTLQYIEQKCNSIENITNEHSKRFSSESSNEELCDIWYQHVLDSISTNFSKCLKDYCHLFVVCFDDALCYDERLMIVPGVRYSIPDQLIDLCVSLNPALDNPSSIKKLKIKLKEYLASNTWKVENEQLISLLNSEDV